MTANKFSKLELTCLGVGSLPIPVIGEVALTVGMYPLVKEVFKGFGSENKGRDLIASVAVTGLMKIGMYNNFPGYKVAYDFLLETAKNLF